MQSQPYSREEFRIRQESAKPDWSTARLVATCELLNRLNAEVVLGDRVQEAMDCGMFDEEIQDTQPRKSKA